MGKLFVPVRESFIVFSFIAIPSSPLRPGPLSPGRSGLACGCRLRGRVVFLPAIPAPRPGTKVVRAAHGALPLGIHSFQLDPGLPSTVSRHVDVSALIF